MIVLSLLLSAFTSTSVHARSTWRTNLRTTALHDACNASLIKASSCEDPADITSEAPLLLASPTATIPDVWRRLKIVTGGDVASVDAASKVIKNQQDFAAMHGYAHEVHIGNYASPWIAYWHKIDVLLAELRKADPAEIVVWMDLDVVVTNPGQDMLERVLSANPGEALILTEDALRGDSALSVAAAESLKNHAEFDAERLVNTGVVLARQNGDAIRVLEQLFEYGRHYRPAAYFPQTTGTLHEQDAFNWLLSGPRKHVWRRYVAVVKQRNNGLNLNTFARSHYDVRYHDPKDARWRTGDFIAHCTGLHQQQREWCVDDSVVAAEEALAADEAFRKGSEHNQTKAVFFADSTWQDLRTLPLNDPLLVHSEWFIPSLIRAGSYSTALF